jgi:hypothetical protein
MGQKSKPLARKGGRAVHRFRGGLASRRQATSERVLNALRDIRHGDTFSRAARNNRVTGRTIRRYAGDALVQDRHGGRIRAAKNDRLTRYLLIPGAHGPTEVEVRGSKTAREFAKYMAATNRFLRGDRNALAEWHGKKIAGIELITSSNTLKSLAERDLLPYSLYRSFAGGCR